MEHEIDHEPEPSAGAGAAADTGAHADDPGQVGAADEPESVQATGDARVDAALAHLGDLTGLPVSDHPPIFERIHGQLVEVLGDLRADPDPAADGRFSGD